MLDCSGVDASNPEAAEITLRFYAITVGTRGAFITCDVQSGRGWQCDPRNPAS
jgi:hypothetical protein